MGIWVFKPMLKVISLTLGLEQDSNFFQKLILTEINP